MKLQEHVSDTATLIHYELPAMSHGSLSGVMGTRFDILIFDKNKEQSKLIWKLIVRELSRLSDMLNRFDPLSEVSRVNRCACKRPLRLSDELWDILLDCRTYHQKTDGLFDITLNDFSTINLNHEDRTLSFKKQGMFIDFGGYGKGYAMKRVLMILHTYEIKHAFIDFGNSAIYGLGHHPFGDSWKVSINNPYHRGVTVGEFSLMNGALSTSGNAPSYTGHIVNPHNGERSMARMMICIESVDPLDAEVLSTAMMVAGPNQKEKMMQSFQINKVEEYKV